MMCMLDLTSKLLTLLVIAYLCTTTTDDELSYIKDASILLKIMTLGQVLTGLLLSSSLLSLSILILMLT